jgi:hypothetical protein
MGGNVACRGGKVQSKNVRSMWQPWLLLFSGEEWRKCRVSQES